MTAGRLVAVTSSTLETFQAIARERKLRRVGPRAARAPDGVLYLRVAERLEAQAQRFAWREHWGPPLALTERTSELESYLEARGVELRAWRS